MMRIVIDARIQPPPMLQPVLDLDRTIGIEFRFVVIIYGIDVECATLEDAKALIEKYWGGGRTGLNQAVDAVAGT